MIPTTYHYATMPLADVERCFMVPIPKDSYLSDDATVTELRGLLQAGYRWIRTDEGTCIFEKILTEGIPANK